MWNDIVKEAIRRASAPVLDVRDLGLGAHRVANTAERVRAAHMLVNAIKYLEPCKRRDYAEQISARASAELPREFMMRAEHVRRLATAGMEVGAHTVNHPILTSVDEDTAMSEISSGKATIEKIIGRPVRFFAYPNGMPKRDFTLRHVEMVKSLGFAAAVTTSSGAASPCSDLFQLPRFGPWDREPVRFVVRLLQCYRRAGAVA
jgi:peptidoglycan/xylan/chitin deacetylase (PgdA/CDA1 family)